MAQHTSDIGSITNKLLTILHQHKHNDGWLTLQGLVDLYDAKHHLTDGVQLDYTLPQMRDILLKDRRFTLYSNDKSSKSPTVVAQTKVCLSFIPVDSRMMEQSFKNVASIVYDLTQRRSGHIISSVDVSTLMATYTKRHDSSTLPSAPHQFVELLSSRPKVFKITPNTKSALDQSYPSPSTRISLTDSELANQFVASIGAAASSSGSSGGGSSSSSSEIDDTTAAVASSLIQSSVPPQQLASKPPVAPLPLPHALVAHNHQGEEAMCTTEDGAQLPLPMPTTTTTTTTTTTAAAAIHLSTTPPAYPNISNDHVYEMMKHAIRNQKMNDVHHMSLGEMYKACLKMLKWTEVCSIQWLIDITKLPESPFGLGIDTQKMAEVVVRFNHDLENDDRVLRHDPA